MLERARVTPWLKRNCQQMLELKQSSTGTELSFVKEVPVFPFTIRLLKFVIKHRDGITSTTEAYNVPRLVETISPSFPGVAPNSWHVLLAYSLRRIYKVRRCTSRIMRFVCNFRATTFRHSPWLAGATSGGTTGNNARANVNQATVKERRNDNDERIGGEGLRCFWRQEFFGNSVPANASGGR